MDEDRFSLHISNIAQRTERSKLIAFFSELGPIERYRYFTRTEQRVNAASILTYEKSVDIDQIIRKYHRMNFDGNTLLLRRILPRCRPAYERFIFSDDLYLSLEPSIYEEGFNEKTVIEYFSRYGTIHLCRTVVPHQSYLVNFDNMCYVDRIILDEPHFYRQHRIRLLKFISPDRFMDPLTRKLIFEDTNKLDGMSAAEHLRRLKHRFEALELVQQIDLKLFKRCFQEKIRKAKRTDRQIVEKCAELRRKIDEYKEKNRSLKLLIEQNEQRRRQLIVMFKKKIQNEQQRIEQLKKTLEFC